jgi:hypothetical protein
MSGEITFGKILDQDVSRTDDVITEVDVTEQSLLTTLYHHHCGHDSCNQQSSNKPNKLLLRYEFICLFTSHQQFYWVSPVAMLFNADILKSQPLLPQITPHRPSNHCPLS